MSGGCVTSVSAPPCDPLEPHLAVPDRILACGLCTYTSPPALRAPAAGAIWLCDLRPRAARALIPHRTSVS
jgi:hypothetical protein